MRSAPLLVLGDIGSTGGKKSAIEVVLPGEATRLEAQKEFAISDT